MIGWDSIVSFLRTFTDRHRTREIMIDHRVIEREVEWSREPERDTETYIHRHRQRLWNTPKFHLRGRGVRTSFPSAFYKRPCSGLRFSDTSTKRIHTKTSWNIVHTLSRATWTTVALTSNNRQRKLSYPTHTWPARSATYFLGSFPDNFAVRKVMTRLSLRNAVVVIWSVSLRSVWPDRRG